MVEFRLRDPGVLPPFQPKGRGETPEEFARRQREAPRVSTPAQLARFISGGGRGRVPTVVTPVIDIEKQTRTESKKIISKTATEIKKDVSNLVSAIRKKFTQSIRGVTDRNDRLNLINSTNQSISNVQQGSKDFIIDLQAQDPNEIVKKTAFDFKVDFSKQLTISEELKSVKDIFLELPGVKQLKAFEEKQFAKGKGGAFAQQQRGKELEARAKKRFEKDRIVVIDLDTRVERFETRAEFQDRTEKGFSATQKFFELFGVQFISESGKQKIISQTLKPLRDAKTTEEQNKAIKDLRTLDINVTSKDGEFIVDTSRIVPTSKLGNTIIQFTDALFKFGLFKPLISTGVAKKGKAKAKVIRVKKAPEKKVKDLLRAFEEEFKVGGNQAVIKRLNQLNKNIETSGLDKTIARQNFGSILKELQRRDLIKTFVYDSNTGKLSFIDKSGKLITPFKKVSVSKPTIEIDIQVPFIPTIKGVAPTGAVISEITRKQTSGLSFSVLNAQTQRTQTTQRNISRTKQLLKQATNQFQKQGLTQRLAQLTTQLSRQKLRTKQLTRLATKQQLKLRKGFVRRIPKFFIPPPFSLGKKKKKVVKKKPVVPTKKPGYLALARQKGKVVRISKVPVTKKKARDISAFFVDRTLSATGIIRRSSKSARKPKLKVPANYFDKNIKKFRTFRKQKGKQIPLKNMFIEKRKFRLDQKNERQTIQQLRKRLLKKPVKTKKLNKKSTSKMKSTKLIKLKRRTK